MSTQALPPVRPRLGLDRGAQPTRPWRSNQRRGRLVLTRIIVDAVIQVRADLIFSLCDVSRCSVKNNHDTENAMVHSILTARKPIYTIVPAAFAVTGTCRSADSSLWVLG